MALKLPAFNLALRNWALCKITGCFANKRPTYWLPSGGPILGCCGVISRCFTSDLSLAAPYSHAAAGLQAPALDCRLLHMPAVQYADRSVAVTCQGHILPASS